MQHTCPNIASILSALLMLHDPCPTATPATSHCKEYPELFKRMFLVLVVETKNIHIFMMPLPCC